MKTLNQYLAGLVAVTIGIAGIMSISSCQSVTHEPLVSTKAIQSVELNFLPNDSKHDGAALLKEFEKDLSAFDLKKEKHIAGLCGMPYVDHGIAAVPPIVIGLITYAAGELAKYIIAKSKKSLKNKLDTYVAQYSNSPKENSIYRSVVNNVPRLSSNCIRFTRSNNKKVSLDLLTRITIENHTLKIQPLRLYANNVLVPSEEKEDKKSVSIAFGFKANAIWASDSRGKEEVVFQKTLFTEKLSIGEGNTVSAIDKTEGQVKYYLTNDENKASTNVASIRLPLVPWTPYSRPDEKNGFASFVMTATEVGVKPELSVLLHKLIAKNEDYLSGLLKDALVSRIKP